MKFAKKISLFSLILLFTFSVGFVTRPLDDYFEISKNLDIFGKLYAELNANYVDETNPTDLMRTGIDAMLKKLDPYTNFISAGEIEDYRVLSTGQYSSIGAKIGKRQDRTLLLELYQNGPAAQAGLRVGDQLIRIDEEEIQQSPLSEVENLLRGENGANVKVTVLRDGSEAPLVIEVKRDELENAGKDVPYFRMVNEEIGYIQLVGFNQTAGKEVADAAKQLKEENPSLSGYILDLRGNPGGLLTEAVNVSNVFIPKDEKIVEMRGRTPDSKNTFRTRTKPIDTELPVAVLINSMSASASEIVSGSIQDLDRGVVVGQRSYGKGLVQNVRPLSYNTQLKITIAKYYTPSGRCIQAIDYSSRNNDGSVGRIADSLKNAFKTRNGRTVYDGGGVEPDIPVAKPDYQAVTQALVDQGILFDFVTQYASSHDTLTSPRSFEVDDALYDEFVTYVKSRDFGFETGTEKQLEALEAVMATEQYKDDLSKQYGELVAQLEAQKGQDVVKHRKEIATLIKKELVGRYFFEEGILEASFDDDPDIIAALEILADSDRYDKVLGK